MVRLRTLVTPMEVERLDLLACGQGPSGRRQDCRGRQGVHRWVVSTAMCVVLVSGVPGSMASRELARTRAGRSAICPGPGARLVASRGSRVCLSGLGAAGVLAEGRPGSGERGQGVGVFLDTGVAGEGVLGDEPEEDRQEQLGD